MLRSETSKRLSAEALAGFRANRNHLQQLKSYEVRGRVGLFRLFLIPPEPLSTRCSALNGVSQSVGHYHTPTNGAHGRLHAHPGYPPPSWPRNEVKVFIN